MGVAKLDLFNRIRVKVGVVILYLSSILVLWIIDSEEIVQWKTVCSRKFCLQTGSGLPIGLEVEHWTQWAFRLPKLQQLLLVFWLVTYTNNLNTCIQNKF